MAKKKARSDSTDAERRIRQGQRLARLLRVMQCILGPGRWDAESLANELECSVRTVHRMLTTLQMAGVPFRYDPDLKAYRVPHGYKFPGISSKPHAKPDPADAELILPAAKRLLRDSERLAASLQAFCNEIERPADSSRVSDQEGA